MADALAGAADIDFVDVTCRHAAPGLVAARARGVQARVRARGGRSSLIHDCPQVFVPPADALPAPPEGAPDAGLAGRAHARAATAWLAALLGRARTLAEARASYLGTWGDAQRAGLTASERAELDDQTRRSWRTLANYAQYFSTRDVLVFSNGAIGESMFLVELARLAEVPVLVLDLAAKGPYDERGGGDAALARAMAASDALLSPSRFVAEHPNVRRALLAGSDRTMSASASASDSVSAGWPRRRPLGSAPPPLLLVPPGVDERLFAPRAATTTATTAARSRTRAAVPFDRQPPLHVVFLGRLAAEKGFGLFFAAARLLRARGARERADLAARRARAEAALAGTGVIPIWDTDGDGDGALPRVRFSAVGGCATGAWTREVRARVACGVYGFCGAAGAAAMNVTGPVPHAAIAAAVASADVVVFPSLYPESFGIVNLEAMAAGVPVVSFAAGGASDYMRGGGRNANANAVVVPLAGAETPDALARGVASLLRNASLRAAIGARARATVLARFTRARAARRYRAAFASIVSGRQAAVRAARARRRRQEEGDDLEGVLTK